MSFYWAVLVMAQLSFCYDTLVFGYYFQAQELPAFWEWLQSDLLYTIRVLAAWWIIRQIWQWCNNYWLAVFLGAELTFICDFWIFAGLFN